MNAAVPEPSPPPGNGEAAPRRRPVALPRVAHDAPVTRSARKNGFMSQQNAQAQAHPSLATAHGGEPSGSMAMQNQQPTVGSIAAHRPHTVAAPPSDLAPVMAADLDVYVQADGGELPQG